MYDAHYFLDSERSEEACGFTIVFIYLLFFLSYIQSFYQK